MSRKDPDGSEAESKGIKSIEVGYRVLLAVQRGPGGVQLAEIAKRAGLSSGAAHNYITSLVRTGLVEQEGRGVYRLGPSAFALSLNSFRQLNGYEVLRAEAMTLHDLTGQGTAVSVWSQAGPISVFVQRSNALGMIDFRPGRVPMLGSAAGLVFAAYLDDADLAEPIAYEQGQAGAGDGQMQAFLDQARNAVLPKGYAFLSRVEDDYYALSAPVWTHGDRIAFVMTVVSREPRADPALDTTYLDALLSSCQRATSFLVGSSASGPSAARRR